MTSICNYSHPELQITDGLPRQKTGILFPYNPEFYDRASGLYGPGAIYCWHLLLASLVIHWSFYPEDEDGYKRPGVTNDLLGVIAFPAFAATDGLIHALKILGTKHRALAFFCLRFPATELTGFAKFNDTQLHLGDIPPDVLNLGQHIIDLTGPITVCYTFAAVFVIMVILMVTEVLNGLQWQPTRWARILTYASYGYVVFVLVIFHLSLGDIFISIIIVMYEAILPFEFFVLYSSSIAVGLGTLGWIGLFINSIVKGDVKEREEALKALPGLFLVATFPAMMIFFSIANQVRLVPDLGISVRERDQMATLIVGIVTLCFTLYDVWVELGGSLEALPGLGNGEEIPLQDVSNQV
ncbi:hypothetical protein BGZ63DRAFT_391461 [Mariannaea sp. PMI_226]|nr:hypothetical protein BGZ63DRAFT_391461 [Mariannaea sp. PMI_226]